MAPPEFNLPPASQVGRSTSAEIDKLPGEILSQIATFIDVSDLRRLRQVLYSRRASRCFATIGAETLRHNLRRVYVHPSTKSVTNFELVCKHLVYGPAIEEIVLLGVRWNNREQMDDATLEALVFGAEMNTTASAWEDWVDVQSAAQMRLESVLIHAVNPLPSLRSIRYMYRHENSLDRHELGFNMTEGQCNRYRITFRKGDQLLLSSYQAELAVLATINSDLEKLKPQISGSDFRLYGGRCHVDI